mgnify:CR=1 FL=1
MERRKELNEIFKDIDPSEKKLIDPLISEVIFLEEQMNELKKLPFISIHIIIPVASTNTYAF